MAAYGVVSACPKRFLHARAWGTDTGARKDSRADPKSYFAQRQKIDTGYGNVAPQQRRIDPGSARQGGDYGNVFPLDQRNCAFSGPFAAVADEAGQ